MIGPEQTHRTMTTPANDPPLVLPLAALDRASLPLAGGKAANLGEMLRAGLPTPSGFCVTTHAYALVANQADLMGLLERLAATPADALDDLRALAGAIRARVLAAPVPPAVAAEIEAAYRALGDNAPVAARSSATAEDLPHASFAGQQETYLNVVGLAALQRAVRQCWASLWTDRAVSYRATNGIDPRGVRLAVVVQRMVPARVAGILFTANPLTGRRRQAVIDASAGLGEAIVSGAVDPDHLVVETATGQVIERWLRGKQFAIEALPGGGTRRVEREAATTACLTDPQAAALAALGARVETHFGAPQDIEWAIDETGRLWLTQSSPITTLFPLPADAPPPGQATRVYFSFNVAQGVFGPLTPMGIQAFRLAGAGLAGLFGRPLADPVAGPGLLKVAAGRLFLDITSLLRNQAGRRFVTGATSIMEARASAMLRELVADPRFAVRTSRRGALAGPLARLLLRRRAAFYVAQAALSPRAARARVARLTARVRAGGAVAADATPAERLDAAERLLASFGLIGIQLLPVAAVGLGASALAGRLLGDLATAAERQTALRALPHNPTTEMDLALWALAQRCRSDAASALALRENQPPALAERYRVGALPLTLQQGLTDFLAAYGHRAVAEIDLGVPRWSDDPTPILDVLTGYLRLDDPALAADARFAQARTEALAMVRELSWRASRRHPARGLLVNLLLRRARALAGLREAPKFHAVLIFAQARALLWTVGEALVAGERLARPDDIFFLTLPEARAALAGVDQRVTASERRAEHEREAGRRHVPRLMLSDGTDLDAVAAASAVSDGALLGSPASAGRVTARARVILDPANARLEPGEILVAPSTDPGWTPLFLTAGGLVMEMGGAMSHGAVVAREYGIPAVVGVPGATARIQTGQRVTVDGAAGAIVIEPEEA